ncbi:DUF4974 domain-containing protein [Pseudoflavitalea sp. G-6-1-2]|uniref:FecR family protein n=1 Tax=Pseudoflavitalea sp. G-6-1-2 TaxID=2728841 RepID=UPI00146DCD6D|nr:FecR family protein [Pseudoflavitalea sp. G-6-1-2]NML20126.1 DUF4974 domain-containing protein [Pseudoflavitalea sp. G-6-1-2]
MSADRIWELIARKLAGEASDAELQELARLLKDNPDLHFPLQAITELWQQDEAKDLHKTELAFHRHLERMKKQGISFATPDETAEESATFSIEKYPRRRKLWTKIAVAATLLAAASLIWYYLQPASTTKGTQLAKTDANSEIVTRNGSRTMVSLPDGSKVWLNGGSRLNYNKSFGVHHRELTLTGEAYFDVVKNAEQPFVIHTSRLDVRVLGTTFNVKAYPNEKTTEAALVKGSIEVLIRNRPAEKIILKPNEKIIVSGDSTHAKGTGSDSGSRTSSPALVTIRNLTISETDSAVVETAWVQNKLVFAEETFAELAKRMERWYGVTIVFTDPRLEAILFTGSFETETLPQALHALKLTSSSDKLKFNYAFSNNNKTVIISIQ